MCFKKGHIIVRICRFEFLGNSAGILNGETVTSPYRVAVLNPSVISLEKITHKNLHVSEPPFFLILNLPSVIPSVTIDRMFPSVYTDVMMDRKNSIGNSDFKLPTEVFGR